ncbi:MAG: alpha/beta hydrolase [Solimicrobium sp.]|jgi:predicted alpha/beta-fold hydrolase|nr:alpha/beta hydrolase [Solimicrobium sp.]
MINGHLQTIIPAKFLRIPKIGYRRERWITPDNDFIDLDYIDAVETAPLIVLFHGLEGSSKSHYARTLMSEVQKRGWAGVVVHFRSCSGQPNNAPRFYHSGDSAEIDWILHRIRQQNPQRTLFVCGVSLGGNALLRWLGESQQQANFVQAATAISAPLDLTQGGLALGNGVNLMYTSRFLRTLKQKCVEKLTQYPGLFDQKKMLAAKNLYEFDNIVTAPLHGYKNTEDYWHRASARHILVDITVPTLVLNAKNDPFLPGRHLPKNASVSVTLDYPEHGGHVGFVSGWSANTEWLPKRILHFFNQHLPTRISAV